MSKSRMEAFSDAFFAIIMTIMVLELKVPHGVSLAALSTLLPVFLSYVLSFVYLGIYWNNHHHLLQCHPPGERRDPLGQPAPAVLALIDSFRHWLDGRKSICAAPHSVVWSDSVARRLRVSAAPTSNSHPRGARLDTGSGGRQGLERQGLHAALCPGDSARVSASVDCRSSLCISCAHVAGPGSANRA